jgi:hypothetical protein
MPDLKIGHWAAAALLAELRANINGKIALNGEKTEAIFSLLSEYIEQNKAAEK